MHISLKTALMASCLSLAVVACSPRENKTMASSNTATEKVLPKMTDAASYGKAAAEWQLNTIHDLSYLPGRIPQSSYNRGWVKGAFYIGLERFAEKTGNQEWLDLLLNESYENGFEMGHRYWHGDDQIMGTIYAGAIERGADVELLKPTTDILDAIIAKNYDSSLEFVEPKDAQVGVEGTCQVRWCWADAIFMAPPAWAAISNVTGDPKYRDYAVKETDATIEYLYDDETGLFFRDSRYFDRKTKNGGKVMWSRGNGWVYAGLARLIEELPADNPSRAGYVELYKSMTDALISRQREDGYWPTSLDDAALFPNPEMSGTAFFTFGIAWGINQGILDGEKYVAARDLGWSAMKAGVKEDGMVGWVQQIGKDPQGTDKFDSQLYGVGGFLLTAAEMIEAGE
ncbi:glycoside hydrolase family 105 protein [Fretibacter rubidus]|uniref:glycoside hydrolase family 88/105 protein n=1 Tax=Fretibacter rubidus TaxID=570162 RepID=UPI00352AC565